MMMPEVQEYDLPDLGLLKSQNDFDAMVWQPDRYILVLGQSNKSENSLHYMQVIDDKIAVYKRLSGGETVILGPGTLVISVSFKTTKLRNPSIYFNIINSSILRALKECGLDGTEMRGISDLAIDGKKILGSSIYRTTNKVLYHAVLNVSEDVSVIEKYIAHPLKEPDYRKGRSHAEFVTSLFLKGYIPEEEKLAKTIKKHIEETKSELTE